MTSAQDAHNWHMIYIWAYVILLNDVCLTQLTEPSLVRSCQLPPSSPWMCVLGLEKRTFLLHYTARYSVISVTTCKLGRRWLTILLLVPFTPPQWRPITKQSRWPLFFFLWTPELVIDRETLEIPTVLPFWKPIQGHVKARNVLPGKKAQGVKDCVQVD